MKYKNSVKILSVALLLGLIFPAVSLATTTPKGEKIKTVGANICTNLVTKLENQNKKLADQLSKFQMRKDEQSQKISENRLNADERRLGVRAKVDENRDNRFSKLEARASTTEQKAAIATFRATLASTTEARRVAVDAAVKAYRASVDQTLGTRKTAVQAAQTTLRASIDSILVKAKADCSANVSNQTIRKTVNDGIKAARQKFAETVKTLDKKADVLKTATEARKTAVDKAEKDFKTAYDKALADLKAAFQK
ncbi:MAG: hypothetical protein WCV68_00265 [Candidatus Paceibacterota bacterium]|jgi:hypothetical protein